MSKDCLFEITEEHPLLGKIKKLPRFEKIIF